MALRKTAIAVPADLLEEVDRAASERGVSRNRFVIHVLRRAVSARRDADVTRRLNELFADESIAEVQRRQAAALDSAGTDWADEHW